MFEQSLGGNLGLDVYSDRFTVNQSNDLVFLWVMKLDESTSVFWGSSVSDTIEQFDAKHRASIKLVGTPKLESNDIQNLSLTKKGP